MKLKILALVTVVLVTTSGFAQDAPVSANRQIGRPLHMLVLGDSILWGQGLKPEHKSWHMVKVWLETNTGRPVVERIQAHSGAVIERASLTDNLSSTNSEVNVGLPTINDQLDDALNFYSDKSLVDLVLLSGCGNDVGVQNLLNASKVQEVDDMTRAKCSKPMENLLRRITSSFPVAQVIVTGYYPFFTEKTRNDFILKALARRFFKILPNGAKMSNKEVFERLKINSKQWYQASNQALADAVQKVNAEIGDPRPRVMFAPIEFPPNYSFAAPQTRLWGFNRSPFRMLLVVMSFGKILLPTNDEVRKQRTAGCKEIYKAQPNESAEERKDRKSKRLFCRYAALGHPNKEGALLYSDAITTLLKSHNRVAASAIR